MAPRWLGRVAVGTAARGRQRTPARVRGGLGKCLASATCARDPAPCEPPGRRRGRRSMPACQPTSEAVHSTPAGRTRVAATKFLLRDHAPPQLRGSSVLAAKMGHADGAHAAPRRAGFWPHRPGVVAPAAAPPASAGPAAGIRGLGSNAGSNAVAGTCARNLCASKSATVDAADWHGDGTLVYCGGSPRERYLPRDSPGRTYDRSSRALFDTGN